MLDVLLWGFFGKFKMPRPKNPDIPLRLAAVTCAWPGVLIGIAEPTFHHGAKGVRKCPEKTNRNGGGNAINPKTESMGFDYLSLLATTCAIMMFQTEREE